ncbi:Hypothetical protein GLP15_1680 [Giardia lamblia P15]|uniref:Uncharacterized protein n=1 Tax=Giardia intestinalis (strain P15) TaxID=658858 RepID=E1EW00_GIAIA|nr:Hypothetical protein GLP15_1680 [Giardia lamblia P15]
MRSLLTKFAAHSNNRVLSGTSLATNIPDQALKTPPPPPISLPRRDKGPSRSNSTGISLNSTSSLKVDTALHEREGSSIRQRAFTLGTLPNLPVQTTARIYKLDERAPESLDKDLLRAHSGLPPRKASFDISDIRTENPLLNHITPNTEIEDGSSDSNRHSISSPITSGPPITGLVSISRPLRTQSALAVLPLGKTLDHAKRISSRPSSELIQNSTQSITVNDHSSSTPVGTTGSAREPVQEAAQEEKVVYPILHSMTPRDQVAIKKQLTAAISRSSVFDSTTSLFITTYKQANGKEYRIYTKEAWPALNTAQQRKPRATTRSILWLHKLISAIISDRYKELFMSANKKEDCSISDDFNCFLFRYMKKKYCTSSEMKKATKELMETLTQHKEVIYSQIFAILLKPLNHMAIEALLILVYLQYIDKDANFSVHNPQIYNNIIGKLRQLDISVALRDFFINQFRQFQQEFKDDTVTDFVQFLVSMDAELDLVVSGQKRLTSLDVHKSEEQIHKPSTVLQLVDKHHQESLVPIAEANHTPTFTSAPPPILTACTSPEGQLSPLSTAPSPLPPLHYSNVINEVGHAAITPSLQSPTMALTVPVESPKLVSPTTGSMRKIASASVIRERTACSPLRRRSSMHNELRGPQGLDILIHGAQRFERQIADDSHFEFTEKDRRVRFDTTIRGIKYTCGKGERGFHRNVLGNDSRVESTDLLSFFEILKLG